MKKKNRELKPILLEWYETCQMNGLCLSYAINIDNED